MSLVPFCFWADMAVLGSSWNFAILLNCDTLEGVFLKCFHRQKNLKKESVGMTWFNFQLPECSSRHTSEADRTSCEPIATIQNLEDRNSYRNGIFTSPDQVLVNRCSGKEVIQPFNLHPDFWFDFSNPRKNSGSANTGFFTVSTLKIKPGNSEKKTQVATVKKFGFRKPGFFSEWQPWKISGAILEITFQSAD